MDIFIAKSKTLYASLISSLGSVLEMELLYMHIIETTYGSSISNFGIENLLLFQLLGISRCVCCQPCQGDTKIWSTSTQKQ